MYVALLSFVSSSRQDILHPQHKSPQPFLVNVLFVCPDLVRLLLCLRAGEERGEASHQRRKEVFQ